MPKIPTFVPYLVICVLVFGILSYVYVGRPDLTERILIKVDVFGITKVSRNEIVRRQQINALSITFEEKQVLANRTVFLDASPDMVKLALGEPKKLIERTLEDKRLVVYLIYYLPNDKRPTILVFLSNKLVKAYKGSALDF